MASGGGSDNSVVTEVDSVVAAVDPVVTEVDPVLTEEGHVVTEADSEVTEINPVVAELDSNNPVVTEGNRGYAAELTQTEPRAKSPPSIRGRAFWDQFPPGSPLPWSQLPMMRMLPDHLFDPSDAAPYPAVFHALRRGMPLRPPPADAAPYPAMTEPPQKAPPPGVTGPPRSSGPPPKAPPAWWLDEHGEVPSFAPQPPPTKAAPAHLQPTTRGGGDGNPR